MQKCNSHFTQKSWQAATPSSKLGDDSVAAGCVLVLCSLNKGKILSFHLDAGRTRRRSESAYIFTK